MFKHAYVRGIQNTLVQAGHAVFPDEDTAAKVADYIADRVDFDPLKGVSHETTAKLAEHIVDASNEFKKQAGFKPGAFAKVASVEDLSQLAHRHVLHLMEKAAEGSTIEGGDKGNKETQSTHAEAKMDLAARPQGYAEDSRGKTDVDTRPGAVGKEEEQPAKPGESPSGSNSVTDQSKTSSLEDLVKKIAATGSTIMGGDKGNKPAQAPHAEAKMDHAQRPEGYAVMPGQGDLGEMMKHFGQGSHVGKEQPNPAAPKQSPSGTNSVVQTSQKSAQDEAWLSVFKKTAAEIMPYLGTMNDDTKVAHVRACMGLTTEEKAHYLTGLQKTAADTTSLPPGSRGDSYQKHDPDATHSRPGAYDGRKANQGTKQAGELPDFLKQKMEEKKEEGGEKKEPPMAADGDKKDEKKDEEKKEASLADHIRRISAAQQAAAPNA